MFKTVQEVFQYLVQQFRQNTGKFPIGKQVDDLMRQAEDYMSKPQITQVDEKKLPKAQIEALPLADKEKAEAAVRKKLEAQNIQAKQAREGGESSGGQRGTPELVDDSFGQTLYIDKSEMTILMDDAQKKFGQAQDAVARGDFDEARAILRYEIEDNYKLPQATRDAAYDARVFIRRGAGIDPKEMGYETMEETLEALDDQISKGVQTTFEDNWPLYTNPDDVSNMKSIEYVNFLDEAGEDFGTLNSKMITPEDMGYEYAKGGRVGFNQGGTLEQYLSNLQEVQSRPSNPLASIVTPSEEIVKETDEDITPGKTPSITRGGTFNPNKKDMALAFLSPITGIANIASKATTGLGLMDNIADALGIGRYGGRTTGFGIDDVNEDSVAADASAGGEAGAAAASAAGANDGPDTGGSFATGGRVGYSAGGIIKALQTMYKGADISYFVDLMNQAKKAGIPIKNIRDLFNFEKQVQEAGGKVYESRKKFPGVEGEKSGLPVDKKVIQDLTDKGELPTISKDGTRVYSNLKDSLKKFEQSKNAPKFEEVFSFDDERNRLTKLISTLQTDMLKQDAIDALKILDYVESVGGDKAMYTDLKMRKYKNLPSKSEYRFDPEDAEQRAKSQINKVRDEVDLLTDFDEVDRTKQASGGLAYLMGL